MEIAGKSLEKDDIMIFNLNDCNRIKKRICAVAVLSIFALSLSSCTQNEIAPEYVIDNSNKLVVYTSHKEVIYKPIIKEFEERTGIWVEIRSGGTNEVLELIAKENGENSCDVMFGGGVDSLCAYEEYFEPYITAVDVHLDKTYASKSNSYTVFSKLPTVFVYNTKLVLPSGAPRTWKQLLEYTWKNNIAFADPEKSGSSYTALSMMVQQLEKDGIVQADAIREFSDNLGGELSKGSDTVVDDVAEGKKMIGITLEENVLKKKATGADIEMIYPDGTCAVPDGAAIVKGCTHRENAEKFMEFIVGDDVQHLLEDQLFRRSVRTDFESFDLPGEIEYDLEYAMKKRREILTIWEQNL